MDPSSDADAMSGYLLISDKTYYRYRGVGEGVTHHLMDRNNKIMADDVGED